MKSAWVEISRKRLLGNMQMFRSLVGDSVLLAGVIKSNAYGHGLGLVAKILLDDTNTNLLAVNSLEEAHQILKLDTNRPIPILIMGDIPEIEKRGDELNHSRFWVMVSRLEQAEFLNSLSQKPKIHLKVDTGMGRLGTCGETLTKTFQALSNRGISLQGIATHFASAEDFTEHSYSNKQLSLFQKSIEEANQFGFTQLIRHCASSASTMLFSEAHMEMVRIGIALYGLWPSLETKLSLQLMGKTSVQLQSVLTWKTKIQHIQSLPANSYIGYGSTFKTTHPTRVAVLPVGYYEGLDRKLSNRGYVLIHGERAPILGRVCMNMSMVDITSIPSAVLNSEVVLLGRSGAEEITADTMADWTGTISYEVVTRILDRLERRIVD